MRSFSICSKAAALNAPSRLTFIKQGLHEPDKTAKNNIKTAKKNDQAEQNNPKQVRTSQNNPEQRQTTIAEQRPSDAEQP